MKTSFDLPDDLYRQLKARSALEGRSVREVAIELFSAWLEGAGRTAAGSVPTPAPGEAWLAHWRSIGERVAHTTPPGLVAQLQHDRR
jgi:hypothetical protein